MKPLLPVVISLLLLGCFPHGSDHFAYPTDGIAMPDLRGKWMSFDMNGAVDSGFQVVIGDLPGAAPTWERLGDGDSVLRTRSGLFYRDGLSFTYWSRVAQHASDTEGDVRYHPAPAMVISFFRLGNDTFFETHLPEQYLDRPGLAAVLEDSLGSGITSTVFVRHHIGRVLRYRPDTILYTGGWSDADVPMRIARDRKMDVVFIPEGTYDGMLHGSTDELRTLLEATAQVDTIRDRYRFVRVAR